MKDVTLQELYSAIIRYQEDFEKNPEYRKIVQEFNDLSKTNNPSRTSILKLLKKYFTFEAENEHSTVVLKRKLIAGKIKILAWIIFFLSIFISLTEDDGIYMFGLLFTYFIFILAECFGVENYYFIPRNTDKYLFPKYFYTVFNIVGIITAAIIAYRNTNIMFILLTAVSVLIIYYFNEDVKHDALANISSKKI